MMTGMQKNRDSQRHHVVSNGGRFELKGSEITDNGIFCPCCAGPLMPRGTISNEWLDFVIYECSNGLVNLCISDEWDPQATFFLIDKPKFVLQIGMPVWLAEKLSMTVPGQEANVGVTAQEWLVLVRRQLRARNKLP